MPGQGAVSLSKGQERGFGGSGRPGAESGVTPALTCASALPRWETIRGDVCLLLMYEGQGPGAAVVSSQ